ncbi:MAG: hypothetical protein BIFFINMI_01858 [Phycisphaerae bacterium]|nr:hypothetical protein [Phycisphaerae bacterium]
MRTAVLGCLVGLLMAVADAATPSAVEGPGEAATVGAGPLDPAAVKPGVWYKRTPLPGSPKNPRMGYEGAWAYDPYAKVILRWGGHNNGGGGEQNSEMWVYNPVSNVFKLMEPNYRPPGACCNRDQVFDTASRRYVRFPSFSASHGWQWRREVYQMQSSAWTYDYATNQWRNMRPRPEPTPGPMRGAAYDTDNDITVVCQGEGVRWGTAVYDLYTNTWAMMNAKNEPPERNTFGFAYDPANRQFVSFGSQNGKDPRTWIYDLRKNEWQGLELTPHPPEVRDGAVMAYDPLHKVVLCVAMTYKDGIDPDDKTPTKVPDMLETWAFDPAKRMWMDMNAKVPCATVSVRGTLMLFIPELNIFVLEVRTNKEQQEWIYRYADYAAPNDALPAAPTDVKAISDKDAVKLTWRANGSADVAGYNVYRGTGDRPWMIDYAKIGQAKPADTEFVDSSAKVGTTCYYYLTAANKAGAQGPASLRVRSQPPVIVDVVVSAITPKKVELAWSRPADDVVGYNVYRAPLAISSTDQYGPIRDKNKLANPLPEPQVGIWQFAGDFDRINDRLLAQPAFTDISIDLSKPNVAKEPTRYSDDKGKPYKFGVFAYRVTSVNRLGVESGPSPYYLTIPGPVADLKSRERKGQTDLRWSANPEKTIVGYRVYRMEGRFDYNGVTLLTTEPIKGTTYTDRIANGPDDDAKRYYVVAVDSLGQEGIVGSKTWGAREYARFYVGFVEEWHQ